jgi:hypothetical protein
MNAQERGRRLLALGHLEGDLHQAAHIRAGVAARGLELAVEDLAHEFAVRRPGTAGRASSMPLE